MKKVAYIASECVPFIKTGGLADVVGTLPKIFDKNEYDAELSLYSEQVQGEDAVYNAFLYGHRLQE